MSREPVPAKAPVAADSLLPPGDTTGECLYYVTDTLWVLGPDNQPIGYFVERFCWPIGRPVP